MLATCCAALFLLAAGATWFVAGRNRVPQGTPADVRAEHRWMPAEPSNRWTCIVIHHSASEAGGADRFDDWHRSKGWDELGYHFVVGNGTDTADGQVEVGPRWETQKHGAHCRTPDDYFNQHGIGICLVGNFDVTPPDELQLQSLQRLVAYLCREFKIEARHIYTHGEVTGQTNCPGQFFDVEAIRTAVASSTTRPSPVESVEPPWEEQ